MKKVFDFLRKGIFFAILFGVASYIFKKAWVILLYPGSFFSDFWLYQLFYGVGLILLFSIFAKLVRYTGFWSLLIFFFPSIEKWQKEKGYSNSWALVTYLFPKLGEWKDKIEKREVVVWEEDGNKHYGISLEEDSDGYLRTLEFMIGFGTFILKMVGIKPGKWKKENMKASDLILQMFSFGFAGNGKKT